MQLRSNDFYDNIKLFFILQVGGHTRLLLLNQSTVIKPLNIRELDFYQNIPSDIQMFVPKYKGKSVSFTFHKIILLASFYMNL